MSFKNFDHEAFYIVQPGDSLWSIAKRTGSTSTAAISHQVERLKKLNPHLRDPDVLRPKDVLALGAPSRHSLAAPVAPADLKKVEEIVRSTSADTLTLAQGAFDVLNYLSHAKDSADFLDNVGSQTKFLLDGIAPFATTVQHADILQVSSVSRAIFEAREEGISLMQTFNTTFTRTPVLLLSIRQNGFYPYAEQLGKVIGLAERIKLGKVLTIADYGIEAAKVGVVAASQDGRAAGRQATQGAFKIGGGAAGLAAGKQVCAVTLSLGPWGVGGCVLALGLGIWGGQWSGEYLGTSLGEALLPPLP